MNFASDFRARRRRLEALGTCGSIGRRRRSARVVMSGRRMAVAEPRIRDRRRPLRAAQARPRAERGELIEITGAREHNLRVDRLTIPKNALVVFTGPSGSGKSSLAFDTLYAEGQRRYVESLSAYARQF